MEFVSRAPLLLITDDPTQFELQPDSAGPVGHSSVSPFPLPLR